MAKFESKFGIGDKVMPNYKIWGKTYGDWFRIQSVYFDEGHTEPSYQCVKLVERTIMIVPERHLSLYETPSSDS